MADRKRQTLTIDAPDGSTLTIELPPRPTYSLIEVVLLSAMALVMAVPTTGQVWGVVRVLTLYVWGLSVIRGAFSRGEAWAHVEHAAVMAAIGAWVEQHQPGPSE